MTLLLDTFYERLVGQGLLPIYETVLRGRNTFRYREEFERNQWLSPDELDRLQWRRLKNLLQHAYDTVPHYRQVFEERGLIPDAIQSPEDFARLPVLEKALIRDDRDSLLSSQFNKQDLILSNTGGSTTGTPVQYYYNRDSYEWRTAAAMRGDRWAGWRLCAPEFYIWGMPLLPQRGWQRYKKQLHHISLRRCIVSSFDLSAERMVELARQYNRQKPQVVIGYANAVYEFARFSHNAGIELVPPQGVVCTAERLYPHQRETIEAAFGTKVFDRYGCREAMMIGAECEAHEGLHATVDNLYIEVVRDGVPCGPGELGEALITDLHNYGMPLIRYRLGDIASWKESPCSCGRGLPLLNPVEGRTLDMITTPSGRIVSGVFFPYLLKEFGWVKAYLATQNTRDSIHIQIQTRSRPPAPQLLKVKDAVCRTLGPDMRVQWEIGPEVEIEKTRKFRPVVSRVPVDFTQGAVEGYTNGGFVPLSV